MKDGTYRLKNVSNVFFTDGGHALFFAEAIGTQVPKVATTLSTAITSAQAVLQSRASGTVLVHLHACPAKTKAINSPFHYVIT